MAYLDFDTLVVCNNDFSEDFLAEFFSFFQERGIQNFIFTYDFDAIGRSVPEALRTLRTLKPYLHRFGPRGTNIYTAFNLILDRDLARNQALLKSISLPYTDRLFVSLPIFCGHEWLENDLAHLVYRKHRSPVFTSFERNAITYTEEMLERFSRLPNSVFCLDANYMFSLRSEAKLIHLLSSNAPILPCISNGMSDYVAVIQGFEDLKERLGDPLYKKLCANIRNSSLLLSRDFTARARRYRQSR